MTEEGVGARGQAVGTRLKDDDQVADLGARQLDTVAENIEGGAQAADDAHRLARIHVHLGADRDREVAPDHGAKVAGRGQVVVQAAVGG